MINITTPSSKFFNIRTTSTKTEQDFTNHNPNANQEGKHLLEKVKDSETKARPKCKSEEQAIKIKRNKMHLTTYC